MKKNNYKVRDFVYLGLIVVIFLAMVFVITNGTYLYGSTLDWYGEHISIPEYFRTLFYHTKDFFPDFAMNIGGGQNIYNLSYYGFLSPIILISYLMPGVSMRTFVAVSTIVCVLVSAVLMYVFLKKKKFSSEICFAVSFMLAVSSPMSFHSHRHIMFINYMPFVILGMFGVDKKFDQNKGWLLTLASFLMIMTSYYYSIGGLVSLFVYALYRYLLQMNKVTVQSFFKTLFRILMPVLVAVLCSAIITLPTLATIVHNRAESNVFITLKDLLVPSINTRSILYYSYGLGLTVIVFLALANCFKENKAKITLGIILTILVVFNLFNYILNGTMYIDSKSLIPFLPLYVYVIALFLQDLFHKKLQFKVLLPIIFIVSILVFFNEYGFERYIIDILVVLVGIFAYYKWEKKWLFLVPVLGFITIHFFAINLGDDLVLKETAKDQEKLISSAVSSITETDNTMYRISNELSIGEYPNRVFENINYNMGTIYSSISNQVYNELYYDTLANNIASRNRVMTLATPNLLGLMLNGNKYVVSMAKPLHGYELVSSNGGLNVYKNEAVLPLGFATSNVMSYEDFERLNFAVQQEALLHVIVADTQTSNKFVPHTLKVDFDYTEILKNENVKVNEDGTFDVNVEDSLKISYELPEKYQDKILFIRFKMNKSLENKDLLIKINNVRNKLTASSWKYYNGNEVFDFVLASQDQKKLEFSFTEGSYNLSDFETYVLDYAYIESVSNKVNRFMIDTEKTKGDKIVGEINVVEDGYFMLTVPYDNGFIIKVDGEKVSYEKVDTGYIGFKIGSGNHKIEVEYKAAMKDASLAISGFGILIFAVITYLESKRRI